MSEQPTTPRGPLSLSKRIENMFSYLYSEPHGNACSFDHEFLDEVKAAALRGCATGSESRLEQILKHATLPG